MRKFGTIHLEKKKTPVNKRVSRNLKNSHLEDDFFGLVSKYLLTAYYISC